DLSNGYGGWPGFRRGGGDTNVAGFDQSLGKPAGAKDIPHYQCGPGRGKELRRVQSGPRPGPGWEASAAHRCRFAQTPNCANLWMFARKTRLGGMADGLN